MSWRPDLVALDVDGTLVDHENVMSPAVRETVNALRDAGTEIVISTGRAVPGVLNTAAKLGFDGYISHRPTLRMEGMLAADAASLREVVRWAGHQPPPGGGFGRFALKAQTNVVGAIIGLSGVNIEVDGNVGEGVLTFDGRQTLQGTLAAEALDLTPYLSTVRLLTSGERGWDTRPIALDGLEGIDVDLRLSAARVNVANAKLGRTAVAVTSSTSPRRSAGWRSPTVRRTPPPSSPSSASARPSGRSSPPSASTSRSSCRRSSRPSWRAACPPPRG